MDFIIKIDDILHVDILMSWIILHVDILMSFQCRIDVTSKLVA